MCLQTSAIFTPCWHVKDMRRGGIVGISIGGMQPAQSCLKMNSQTKMHQTECRDLKVAGNGCVRNTHTQCSMVRDVSTEESGVDPPEMSQTMENIGSTARDVCGSCYFATFQCCRRHQCLTVCFCLCSHREKYAFTRPTRTFAFASVLFHAT